MSPREFGLSGNSWEFALSAESAALSGKSPGIPRKPRNSQKAPKLDVYDSLRKKKISVHVSKQCGLLLITQSSYMLCRHNSSQVMLIAVYLPLQTQLN